MTDNAYGDMIVNQAIPRINEFKRFRRVLLGRGVVVFGLVVLLFFILVASFYLIVTVFKCSSVQVFQSSMLPSLHASTL